MVRTVDAYCPVKVEKEEDEMLDLDEFTVEEPICDPSYFGVQSPKVEELVSGFLDGSGEFIFWGDLWHFLVWRWVLLERPTCQVLSHFPPCDILLCKTSPCMECGLSQWTKTFHSERLHHERLHYEGLQYVRFHYVRNFTM